MLCLTQFVSLLRSHRYNNFFLSLFQQICKCASTLTFALKVIVRVAMVDVSWFCSGKLLLPSYYYLPLSSSFDFTDWKENALHLPRNCPSVLNLFYDRISKKLRSC